MPVNLNSTLTKVTTYKVVHINFTPNGYKHVTYRDFIAMAYVFIYVHLTYYIKSIQSYMPNDVSQRICSVLKVMYNCIK